ncbi:hypothetical protein GCM10027610_056280 [Dactylosporangium cerinum]
MGDGSHVTPAHLSVPDRANCVLSTDCSAASTFTVHVPARLIDGNVEDVLATETATNRGSTDTLKNDWQVIPTGFPSTRAVSTVTPEQKCPSTDRNCASAPVLATP